PNLLHLQLRSPQLQQALSALSVALQSDNFNSIMSSFNLDPSNPASADALARGDAIEALMQVREGSGAL
ncbi:unnamed protein product, partial [Discosporangium mesarthrocarpum]